MKNKFYQILLMLCLPVVLLAKTGNTNIAGKENEWLNAGKKLSFIENKGQVHDQDNNTRTDIQYSLRAANGLNIFIGNGAIHYQFSLTPALSKGEGDDLTETKARFLEKRGGLRETPKATTIDMYRMDVELVGVNKNARVISEEKQEYYENYNLTPTLSTGGEGDGPKGITAHAYNRITYKDIYPNIDWVLYTSNGQLKHEFVVRQGGKVSDIKLKYGGVTDLKLNADGTLTATTPQGAITEQAPNTLQKDSKTIKSSFALNGDILSFNTGAYAGELIIDPTLEWATYYGGSDLDHGLGVATDNSGNVFITGYTISISAIATSGAYQIIYGGGRDAFLAKFNGAGSLQWATYYGGSADDVGYDISTDIYDNVYMTGYTMSVSLIATSGAYQRTLGGDADAFLVKFNSSGAIQWATYYGGVHTDLALGVAIDGSGNIYVTGQTTSSSSIATPGAYQDTLNGGGDAFLVKFNDSGIRQWATYFGGNGNDIGQRVATDRSGNVYIAGYTTSTSGLVTSGGYQPFYGGGKTDAFIAKFDCTGNIQWATYFGGSGDDYGYGITTDGSGGVYIAGSTDSLSVIATSGAYQPTYGGGGTDAFLVKFNSTGAIQWATYFGGVGFDIAYCVTTDGLGNIYMTGSTAGLSAIATIGAYDTIYGGGWDAFLVKFNSLGGIQWATYYGGASGELGYGVATDGIGNVFITGETGSASDIASPGAFQPAFSGGTDVFLAKFHFIAPITGTTIICLGGTTTLRDTTAGGTWSSSNTAIATIGLGTGIVTGISGGTATITYSVSGNSVTTTVAVNSPGLIKGITTVCTGQTITLSDAGGGTWSSSNTAIATIGTSSGIVTGILAGTATITYTLTGCITTTSVIVNPAPKPISVIANVCEGFTTTLSDITAGGTWSSNNTVVAIIDSVSGIATGISAGTATITYTVLTGCAATLTLTVNPLPPAITGNDFVCTGSTTALSDAITGGDWNSSNTAISAIDAVTGIVTGVSAGTTTITYLLPTGCFITVIETVNPSPAINGIVPICAGNTGTLSETINGGTWSSSNTGIATVDPGSGLVTGVSAGTALITYALTSGCIAVTTVTIAPLPDAGAISGQASSCADVQFTLSETVSGGTWSSNDTGIATIGSTTGIVNALSPGTATITYTTTPNPDGCINSAIYIITIISMPLFTINSNVTPGKCYGYNSSIEITISGGSGPYRYSWSNGDSSPVINNLASGTYRLQVTEISTGCTKPDSFYIAIPDSLHVTADVKGDVCKAGNGSVSVVVTGGTPPYRYLWSNNTTGSGITALPAGAYSFIVTDANICEKSVSITVEDSTCNDVNIHDVITPNGDGINDVWVIEGIENYPSNTVQLYDKLGDKVFEKGSYHNDWNGISNTGTALPDGTYFYLVKLNAINASGGKNVFSGALLIKR